MDEIRDIVDVAAGLVEKDMVERPPTAKDGIWRFDRLLGEIFGDRPREFWVAVEAEARSRRGKSWSGYDIVASYAGAQKAFLTPGFGEARRKYMS